MAEFVLKNWHGEKVVFNQDKIFVEDVNGNRIQFTEGAKPTLGILEVNKNGVYDATGVSGYDRVIVEVEAEVNETLFNKTNFTGFAVDDSLGGLYSKSLGFGTDIEPLEIILGREYTVSWDGELYKTVAKDTYRVFEEEDPIDETTLYRYKYYLGNGSLLGYSDLEDTGESFVIVYQTYSNELVLISIENLDSHNVAIMKRVRPRDGLDMMLQSITVTENGTYTADPFYDGLKQVMVEVAGTSSADVRYVTFKSYDGLTEYGKKAVAVGDDCADPIVRGIFDTPTKESTPQYNFTHNGWANEPNGVADANWNKAIMEDKTVYASFKNVLRYYTASLYVDNALWKTEQVPYGGSVTSVPIKDGYTFNAWSPSGDNITEDTILHAVFTTGKLWTWDELINLVDDNNSVNTYLNKVNIGDTATLNLGTEGVITMQVTALRASSAVGDPHIKFVAKELLATSKPYATSTYKPFTSTSLYSYLQDTILPLFPENLRNKMAKISGSSYSGVRIPYSRSDVISVDESYAVKCKTGTTTPIAYWIEQLGGTSSVPKVQFVTAKGVLSDTYSTTDDRGVCLMFYI